MNIKDVKLITAGFIGLISLIGFFGFLGLSIFDTISNARINILYDMLMIICIIFYGLCRRYYLRNYDSKTSFKKI